MSNTKKRHDKQYDYYDDALERKARTAFKQEHINKRHEDDVFDIEEDNDYAVDIAHFMKKWK